MASFVFKARLHEVARAHLRDAFLLAQRPLTDAVIAIFKKTSGAEWASKLKSYVGQSMKDHVADDGRAFDMYVRLRCSDAFSNGCTRASCNRKVPHQFEYVAAFFSLVCSHLLVEGLQKSI